MPHILLVARGTGGDLFPFMRIGCQLKALGYTVTLFTHCYYADRVTQAGLNFVPLETAEEFAQMAADLPHLNHPRAFVDFYRQHLLPRSLREFQLLKEYSQADQSLLVMQDNADLAVRLAGERLNLPVVSVFLAPYYVVNLPVLEMLCKLLAPDINRARAQLDLTPVENWGAWLKTSDGHIALWPEWFAPPTPDWPVPAVPVGFVLADANEAEPLPTAVQEIVADPERPILIAHGTSPSAEASFFTASVEACRLLGRRGIVVTRHAELVPQPLPAEVSWFEYLPFDRLLPQLAAVVHHGGIGTVGQALAASVPQLILGAGFDRPDNGQRLQRLGVGGYLPPPWRPEAVARMLQYLLSTPKVRLQCQRVAQTFATPDLSVVAACESIVACLR